jgi:hypothetical protein
MFAKCKEEMFLPFPCNYYLSQMYPQRDLLDQWVQLKDSWLEASVVFGPLLEFSKPPSTCIGSLLSGRGVSSQVSS